ncbi:MAG: adenylosuccinate synthase [Saprospiraceae bacterium]|nr:adenylosuccinate synthase [Saprospiraceae bacterium]
MKIDVLLGLQWGDEGKGKIVDVLSPRYDIVARFQGGPNAGHTLIFNNKKHVLHLIPSGIFHENTVNIIGNGVILDPLIFKREIKELTDKNIKAQKNLLLSKKTHLILPTHRLLDAAYESSKGKLKIGSTLKGIGPTYTDKTARTGLRIGNIFNENFKEKYDELRNSHLKIIGLYDFSIKDYLIDGLSLNDYEDQWFESLNLLKEFDCIDSEQYINDALKQGKSILAEGAQGTLLDIDYGSYPFVTSSNTITSAVCSGLGVAPSKIGKVFGIFKAYCTRVGSGPFPTEQENSDGQLMRDEGREYGSTTGRPRRCGWLDMPALKYAIMLNGVTDLIMSKVDVLSHFQEICVCTEYNINNKVINYIPFEISDDNLSTIYKKMKGWNCDITSIKSTSEFPDELKQYYDFIQNETGVNISIVSVGPDRKQTIEINK